MADDRNSPHQRPRPLRIRLHLQHGCRLVLPLPSSHSVQPRLPVPRRDKSACESAGQLVTQDDGGQVTPSAGASCQSRSKVRTLRLTSRPLDAHSSRIGGASRTPLGYSLCASTSSTQLAIARASASSGFVVLLLASKRTSAGVPSTLRG